MYTANIHIHNYEVTAFAINIDYDNRYLIKNDYALHTFCEGNVELFLFPFSNVNAFHLQSFFKPIYIITLFNFLIS